MLKNVNKIGRIEAAWCLTLWWVPCVLFGQPHRGHFVYNIISYEILDSANLNSAQANDFIESIRNDFEAHVYFNKSWVVSVQEKHNGVIKRMYNRRSQVLYNFFDIDEQKNMSFDSIQVFKKKDKLLLAALDTLIAVLGIIEFPEEKRMINKFSCHKVTIYEFAFPRTTDEVWIAKFPDVPDLIFPSGYFLVEGIPIEITQDFQTIKVKWGVTDVLPIKRKDDIFKLNQFRYEVTVDETKEDIYKMLKYIKGD